MHQELSHMTNEELWQLFPILLCEHDPRWHCAFLAEKELLEAAVGKGNIVRINHIGSTAVCGLIAKPTIDILLEVNQGCDVQALVKNMEGSAYRYSPQIGNPPPHMMFLKGYTSRGFVGQAFHVHVRYCGDWPELYFRDYLRLHDDVAHAYGALKAGLKERYEHDRDGYTQAKTAFIIKVTESAKKDFGDRYKPADLPE